MSHTPKTTKDPLIWEFNYKPERYIDSTWLENLPNGQLLDKLRQNKRDTSQLSHYLLGQLGFNGEFYFNFKDPIAKVALSAPSDLKKLIFYIGITYHHHEIRQVITQKHVMTMKADIGEELYEFGLKQSPNIARKPLSCFTLPQDMPLSQRCIISGMICLNVTFKSQPNALRKRLLIKLPKPWIDLSAKHMNQKHPPKAECIYLTHKVAELINMIPKTHGIP